MRSRKTAFDQESDQKKKENTLSPKKATKKKEKLSFFFSFINSHHYWAVHGSSFMLLGFNKSASEEAVLAESVKLGTYDYGVRFKNIVRFIH